MLVHEPAHQLAWGFQLGQPDWSYESPQFGPFRLRHPKAKEYLHVMLNAHWGHVGVLSFPCWEQESVLAIGW